MLEPIAGGCFKPLRPRYVGLNQYIRAWVKRMFGYTASDSPQRMPPSNGTAALWHHSRNDTKSQVWMAGFGWLNLRNFEMFLTMQSQLGPCIYIYIIYIEI